MDVTRYDTRTIAMLRELTRGVEGASAKSLYFQFKDGPVDLVGEAAKLRDLEAKDLRYMRISIDINLEVSEQRAIRGSVILPAGRLKGSSDSTKASTERI